MAIKRTRNSGLVVPSLEKGIIGGDTNSWGNKLNSNIDKQSEFYTKLVQDSETQNQDITRLDKEKISTSDIPTIVEPIVIQEVETIGKPMLDDYMNTTIKPQLNTYTSGKKSEIDSYVTQTSKPSLDSYEKTKESELNSYTTTKKGELDTYTSSKQTQLDNYEKTKETQLNSYTSTKQTQLDSYTSDKKSELDSHTSTKKSQLDSYEKSKESELDTYTTSKKGELDTYESAKESELNSYTSTKKNEINSHTTTKKSELDTYTTSKKSEITTHTDSEIKRINADSELANKVSISDVVDNLTTADKSKVLSANMGVSINSRLTTYKQITVEGDGDTFYPVRIRLSNEFNSINLLISKSVHNPTTNDGYFRLNIDNITHRTWGNYPTPSYNVVYSGSVTKFVYNFYSSGNQGNFFVMLLRGGGRLYTFSSEKEILDKIDVYYESVEISGSQEGYKLYEEPRTGKSKLSGVYDSYSNFRAVETMQYLGGVVTYTSKYNKEEKKCISYIQDEGTKIFGSGYIDKTTGKLYRCVNTTTDTDVTTNFELATNIDNSSRLALIEERLGIYSPVGKIQSISVSRNEDSSSPTLTYSSV